MAHLQLSESTEMYLKAMSELGDRDVAIARLAERLGVTNVSANEMMRRLGDQGLVTRTPYKGVTLTKKGREVASNVIRRQRLWERFLYDHLKIEWALVYELACSLEHATATDVLKYLQEKKIMPGQKIKVLEAAPLQGPLTVLSGGKEVALGLSLAQFVIVE